MKRFLIKHVGNMGDLVFFVPPILETLKKNHPGCHITFVTAWGFKQKEKWGERNQGGFCISLMMTNPHVDQLVHFHETKTDLSKSTCIEEGVSFPTWSRAYYEEERGSGGYDGVFELDIGIRQDENPIEHLYRVAEMPRETFANYKLYFTPQDMQVARYAMEKFPHPRIVLLEGIEGTTTRGWDPGKIPMLEKAIEQTYGAPPLWFGAKHVREYLGRQLTLRENIATLSLCDVAIGLLSGPLHFAAATGLPTISLFCDQPLHRAAPAFFLNEYISDDKKKHRTLLGPTGPTYGFLKEGSTKINLTEQEWKNQKYINWTLPWDKLLRKEISTISRKFSHGIMP